MRRIIALALLLVFVQSAAILAPFAVQPLVAARQQPLVTSIPTQTPRSIWATRAAAPVPTLTLPQPSATLIPTLPQMVFATLIVDTSVPTWNTGGPSDCLPPPAEVKPKSAW